MAATEVTARSKGRAAASGLKDNLASATPNPMYSARDGEKRSFMLMTEPNAGGGTQVTVNWGRDLS